MSAPRTYVKELWWPDTRPRPSDWEELLEEWDVDVVPPYQIVGEDVYSLAPLPMEAE